MLRLFDVSTNSIHTVNTKHSHWILEENDVISNSIVHYGRWEPWLVDMMMRKIKVNSNVIDIGANIGTWTIPMSEHAKKVFSFEPNQRVYQQLNANLFLNHRDNVKTFDTFLSNVCDKKVYMSTPDPNNIGMMRMVDFPTNIDCITNTLDSYHFTDVSFIKIDVEGHELSVLEGAKQTILRERPAICFETWNGNPDVRDSVLDLLKSYGMTTTHIYEDDFFAFFS